MRQLVYQLHIWREDKNCILYSSATKTVPQLIEAAASALDWKWLELGVKFDPTKPICTTVAETWKEMCWSVPSVWWRTAKAKKAKRWAGRFLSVLYQLLSPHAT